MTQFKVGDSVRILHTDFPDQHDVGSVGTVVGARERCNTDGCGWQGLDIIAPGWADPRYYYSSEVELAWVGEDRLLQGDDIVLPKDLGDGSSIRLPAGTLHFEGAKLRFVPDAPR